MGELKKTTISNVIIAIVFLLLGLMLTFKPDFTVSIIINVLGAIFVGYGVLRVINYYNNKKHTFALNYDLLTGIIGIVLGIAIIVFGKTVIALFRIIVGIWIIYSAILRLELMFAFKKSKSNSWVYVCVLAILMLTCGLYITFNSNAIISTIGIVVIVYSVIDLIENIIALRNMKNIIIM